MKPNYEEFLNKVLKIQGVRPSHCDPYVTHSKESCRYCAMPGSEEIHKFRQDNKICYTGEIKQGWWPCPSEERRSLKNINKWHGNVAIPHGCECTMFKLDDHKCPIHNK